ncbi:MAG: hypothetical protein N2487_05085, partial [Verrucomicrobiae bacterium]|nr:hypothetical protein [Verrucomicrobiae bacterium]
MRTLPEPEVQSSTEERKMDCGGAMFSVFFLPVVSIIQILSFFLTPRPPRRFTHKPYSPKAGFPAKFTKIASTSHRENEWEFCTIYIQLVM